jgi:methyl-accepting chemotaxis protein
MKNWPIGKRIVFGIAILTLIVAGVGGLGYVGLKNTITQAQSITQQTKDHGRFLAESINLARTAQLDFKKQVQEWKDTLLRGNDPDLFKKYSEQFAQREGAVDQDLAALKKLFGEQGVDTKSVEQSLAEHQKLGGRYREALKSYNSAKPDSCFVVDKLVAGMDRPATDAIDGIVQQVQQFEADTTKTTEEHFRLQTARIQMLVLGGLITGVLFAVGFGWTLIRSLTRQLYQLAENLGGNSRQIAAAADQVSAASQSLAEGSSEQAASIEETSSSLEEMASMTRRNADNARNANDLAKQAREAADKGASDMQIMSAAMEAIKVSSNDISKIIKTIDEIAFQTNILALNAAVEAARAGEAGMGFAVVADEVRSLAQRSAAAAKETADKIEGAITKTGQGVEINSKVAAALNDIVAKVRQVDELVTEVANASREQTEGITQINTAVGQMDKVTQSNAANAEESAAAAEELNAQAGVMKQSVIELLQLVGSAGETAANHPASDLPHNREFRGALPGAKRPAPVTAGGHSNGNGHPPAAPAMTMEKRRATIPLEGNFTDF